MWINASTSETAKSQPVWGTAPGPTAADQQPGLKPPAHNCSMVHTEDPLEIAQTQSLHPAGTAAAFEALNNGGRSAFDTEPNGEACGDFGWFKTSEERVDKVVFGLSPTTTAAAAAARTAAGWTNRTIWTALGGARSS